VLMARVCSSELYGVEPLSYYIRNLALNFNVALPVEKNQSGCLL
jgi:hypothetical protein